MAAAEATCLAGLFWGASRAKRHGGAFSRESILQTCQLCCSALPATKHPCQKAVQHPDTGNMQLCRPALLCNASAGGSAQAQPELVTVTAGPAEVLGANALRAAKPAHTAWTGKLLWTMPTTAVLLAQPVPPNTVLLQSTSKTLPVQPTPSHLPGTVPWVIITLDCTSGQAKQRVQS